MNIQKLLSNSSIMQGIFKTDLKDKSKGRGDLVKKIDALRKELANLSTKPISDIEADIKKTEIQLAKLKEQRVSLIIADRTARDTLSKQIKAAEHELKRECPIIVGNAIELIHERIKTKSVLLERDSVAVNGLLNDLNSLVFCTDEEKIMAKVADIEARAAALL